MKELLSYWDLSLGLIAIVVGIYKRYKLYINRKYDELMPIVLKSLKVACNCIELYYKMETNIENRINIQLY